MSPTKFVLCIAIASCITISVLAQGGHGRPAKTYSADVAVSWFELMYDRVKADGISPPVASRRYGIAAVAFYESIVPGMPGHASLGGQLNQLGAFTPPAQAGGGLIPPAVPSAKALSDNIKRLKLDVQVITPFHGNRTTNVAELEKAAAGPATN